MDVGGSTSSGPRGEARNIGFLAQACRTLALFRDNRPCCGLNGAATHLKRLPVSTPTWRDCRTYQRRRRMPRDCKKIESALALNLYLHVSGASLRNLACSGLSAIFRGRLHLLPRCGNPTDRRCDHCCEAAPDLQGHALCCHCDATLRMCRLCRLELQLRRGLRAPTIRPASESSWEGASQCANCGEIARKLQICSGCMCIRYCSLGCQRLDWKKHKPLCAFLKELHPLTFVYPWHMKRARRAAAYYPALLSALAGEI